MYLSGTTICSAQYSGSVAWNETGGTTMRAKVKGITPVSKLIPAMCVSLRRFQLDGWDTAEARASAGTVR